MLVSWQNSEPLGEFAQLGAWPQAGELEQVASDIAGDAVGAGLLDSGGAQMRVDDGDDPALRWLVRNHVRGSQPFKESHEPRVHGLECAELLEQILGGPVARISEHMPLDLAAQTSRAAGE